MKDILGFEGKYAITKDGRVYSFPKNNGRSPRVGKFLTTHQDGCGYNFAVLQSNKTRKQPKVHRLVAETFLPNPNNFPQINILTEINRITMFQTLNGVQVVTT